MTTPTTLVNPFTATIDDAELGPIACPTILTWDPTTPAALHFQFHPVSQNEGVTWAVGRQLVLDALATPGTEFGEGDVCTSSTALHFMMVVRSPEGTASVRMPASAVRWVVNTSASMIAPGSDAEAHVLLGDVEAELEFILGDAA